MKTTFLSLFVATSVLAQPLDVRWRAETASIPSFQAGDPALTSFIIGTDTAQQGLYLFDLSGAPAGNVPVGIVRSVDVRGSLVAASSAAAGILLYRAGVTPTLTVETPSSIPVSTPGQVALGALPDGGFTLWFDTSSPVVRQYALPYGSTGFTPTPLLDVQLPGVPSGLAYDDAAQRLFAAVPNVGVLVIEADGGVSTAISSNNGLLGTTLGGIALYRSAAGVMIFTTSPGEDAVFVNFLDLANGLGSIGSFTVSAPDGGAQKVRSPAYIDVAASVPGFSNGALLLHDGTLANYKLVSLDDLNAVISGDAGMTLPDGGPGVRDAGPSGGDSGGSGSNPGEGWTGDDRRNCSTAPIVALPALLLLWWIRRPRS